jgi:nucleoside-diphosphate-sugar epimerase
MIECFRAVADHLLSCGLKVRGVTRSVAKAQPLHSKLQTIHGPGLIDFVEVGDPLQPDAYSSALQGGWFRRIHVQLSGVSGLIHMAVDLSSAYGSSPNPDVSIHSAVDMTLGVLKSAQAIPTMKSVVVCSTIAAVYHPEPGHIFSTSITHFNELSIKLAYDLPDDHPSKGYCIYMASKTRAEQELWSWVEKVKMGPFFTFSFARWDWPDQPRFAINTVLPAFVCGPAFNPGAEHSSTSSWVSSLFKGQVENNPIMGVLAAPTWFVDVRDSAILHVAALLASDVNGQRILAAGHPPDNGNKFLAIWREAFPSRIVVSDFDLPEPERQELDRELSTSLLQRYAKRDWLPFEKTLVDNVIDAL